ncbi:MAG TPA: hypothetical protein VKI99_21675 [Candidatus Dormibacteraeota bacterium]|nr:hypothetical protein [Candidatus Dormibacteraeota bacterium]
MLLLRGGNRPTAEDGLSLGIVRIRDLEDERAPSQELFCHAACLRNVVAEGIPVLGEMWDPPLGSTDRPRG